MKRVELACHTGYSRMDGIGLGEDWAEFIKEKGIETFVVTDDWNVDGFPDLQRWIKAMNKEAKVIMGVDLHIMAEFHYSDGNDEAFNGNLSILVKNETGKKNLYLQNKDGEPCL